MMKSREDLIKEYLEKPLEIGDYIIVPGNRSTIKVTDIDENSIPLYRKYPQDKKLTPITNYKKCTRRIGYNPISTRKVPRLVNYTLESILDALFDTDSDDQLYKTSNGIVVRACNFNPYVIDSSGKKYYYQRDYCWTIEQCQNLLESLYNKIDCGKIVIRKQSLEELDRLAITGEKELFFLDIVDGKQRATAIWNFINNKYPDKSGVYYRDFSIQAQRQLLQDQLITYCVLDESTTDEETIQQFLLQNFSGVPQSTEHLDKVNEILNTIRG